MDLKMLVRSWTVDLQPIGYILNLATPGTIMVLRLIRKVG